MEYHNNINSETVGGMMQYLDQLQRQYRSESSKIVPLRSAVRRVFRSIYDRNWEDVSVKKIDLDDIMSRFRKTPDNDFGPATLAAYQSRITRALNWYTHYLGDNDWAPFDDSSADSGTLMRLLGSYNVLTSKPQGNNEELVSYPFPLSDGRMVTLQLPKSLSRNDAERLKTFISSLVTERG